MCLKPQSRTSRGRFRQTHTHTHTHTLTAPTSHLRVSEIAWRMITRMEHKDHGYCYAEGNLTLAKVCND